MFKIETENLILRDMVEADIEKHMCWFTTEEAWWNWDAAYWYLLELTGYELDKEIENQKIGLTAFYKMIFRKKPDDRRYAFEIEEKNTGELIGWISCYCIDLNFEATDEDSLYAFGIDIPEMRFRKKGYGKQAFSAAIEYYKSIGIDEVFTQTWSGNIPMIKLAEKIGFHLVDTKKDMREHNGQKFDALTFRI